MEFFSMKHPGFSLVEVLVSILLMGLIMAALTGHYLGIKQQYKFIQRHLEQDLELKVVIDLMQDSIRHAGFTPCLGIEHLTHVDTRNPSAKIMAIEASSDNLLRVKRMSSDFEVISDLLSQREILVPANYQASLKNPILIADCTHAEVQMLHGIRATTHGKIMTLAVPMTFTYTPPIYVGEWLDEAYILKPRTHYSAFFYLINHRSEELTRSIQHFLVKIQEKQFKKLLQVELNLDNEQKTTFVAMVREFL